MSELNLSGFRNLEEKEDIDIQAWARHGLCSQNTAFLHHKVNKMAEARAFINKLDKYQAIFYRANSVLELGGGSCWASYIVKTLYPETKVTGTDIAPSAIENSGIWADVFQAHIDDAVACKSYELPFEDNSFYLIFSFASAHHFGKHAKTFSEVNRVLKPGGKLLYLYEPGCRRYIYPLAHWRVNRKRPEVPEDVLVYRHLLKLCRDIGLEGVVNFDPSVESRGAAETLYFTALRLFPFLQDFLPCTIDMVVSKPG